MKPITLLLLALLCSGLCFGQDEDEDEDEYENQLAAEVFKSGDYKPGKFPKFTGRIEKSGKDFYWFGERVLQIEAGNDRYGLFSSGIFNPDIIFGKTTDSLSICCLNQMKWLNPNPQTKRFEFWVFTPGIANPTEYYIELKNKAATKNTPLEKFIKGATMTFFFKGTVII